MIRCRITFAASVSLAACGSGQKAAELPQLSKLDTVIVQAGGSGYSRTWDGVLEAVQQADLSAQTAGRVVAVDADVNDDVAAGAVLLRLTAVEQLAGANDARAQLRAADAAATEAEATFVRYSALASKQLVSRLQIDQLRAARDSAVAARDAAHAQLAGLDPLLRTCCR